jgi:hypothetical protein
MEVTMSALGLDYRDDPRGSLAYAQRRHRRADESSIRPVLERLSRSEGRVPGPRLMPRAPVQQLPQPDIETVARSAFPMAARLALAAGVLALVGVAGAGYLLPPGGDRAAAPAPAATADAAGASEPKPVQTISIQRSDRLPASQPDSQLPKSEAGLPQSEMSLAGASGEAFADRSPQAAATVDPSTAPLEAWAKVPAAMSTPSWPATVDHAMDAAPAADDRPPDRSQGAPAHRAAPVRHTRNTGHSRRTRSRHRAARAHAVAQHPEAAAQPAETEQPAPPPIKKLPLQAAIDRLVGNASASSTPPPPQQ